MQIDCLQDFISGAYLGYAVEGVNNVFRAQAARIASEANQSSLQVHNTSTSNHTVKSRVSASAPHSREEGSAMGANYSHRVAHESAAEMLAGSGTLTSNMSVNKCVVFAAALLIGGSLSFVAIHAKRSQSTGEAEQCLLQP